MRYAIAITFEVETDNALEWAWAAAEHLDETFNDDGTLVEACTRVEYQRVKENACSS
jgi:hypothetical protein